MQNNNEMQLPKDAADDPRVTAYVFGQLEGAELQAFEQLLNTDAEYRQIVEQTRELTGLLESSDVFEPDVTPALSSSRMTQLESAFGSSSGQRHELSKYKISADGSRSSRWLPWLAVLSSAAALSGVLLWNRGPTPELSDTALSMNDQQNVSAGSQADKVASLKEEAEQQAAQSTKDLDVAETDSLDELATITSRPEAPNSGESRLDFEKLARQAELKEKYGPDHPFLQTPQSGTDGRDNEADYSLSVAGEEIASNKSALGSGSGRSDARYPVAGAGGYGGGPGGYPGGGPGSMGAGAGMGDMAEGIGMGQPKPAFSSSGYPGSGGQSGSNGYGGGYGEPQSSAVNESVAGRSRRLGVPSSPLERRKPTDLRTGLFDNYQTAPAGSGDRFAAITDNRFESVSDQPLSTFSIDVDTASYSKLRMMLQQYESLPSPDSVRIEEMLNYFKYDYQGPKDDTVPFAANMELATCPWNEQHKLARIALKGREVANAQRTVSNLVFLLDVSGSMNQANKLPLVRRGMEMLVSQLGENDRVAIVVYAGAAGLVLDSTTADNKEVIFSALDRLQAGGSTNGGQGIQLAYETARDHFIQGGTNRVILCTDGDFNVGTTGKDQLVKLVEEEAKGGVFLSVLGFGTGNLNDDMLEAISGKGDGNYAFIDTSSEAHKVLVEQLSGTLVTIAKDVKIQIEFNPTLVESYRLIGYENRMLAAKDFADDTKDAGEIGAGHTVTALYEIVPVGLSNPNFGELKYQQIETAEPEQARAGGDFDDELLTLKLRYKAPEGGSSKLLEFPIKNTDMAIKDASEDFRFASAVAAFGMLLRDSPHRGNSTFEQVRNMARGSLGEDEMGLRAEFLGLVDTAARLHGPAKLNR